MARAVGINHVALEVGSIDEALVGLELGKSESALRELREKGLG